MYTLIASVLLVLSFVIPFRQVEAAPLPIAAATASAAQAPNVASHSIDGNFKTRWAVRGEGQWIEYELATCDIVSSVNIDWSDGERKIYTFTIETSEDGMAWTLAHSGDSDGKTRVYEPVDIEDVEACYVRIVGFGNNKDNWTRIVEVEIEGAAEVPPGVLPVLGVTASVDTGTAPANLPANTIDGNPATRWSARGVGQWIQFDLGETNPVLNEVSIAWVEGNTRSATFDIEVSTDGETFTKVYGGYSSGTTLELQPYFFADVSARYVRIIGLGNSKNDWTSISEVQFSETD